MFQDRERTVLVSSIAVGLVLLAAALAWGIWRGADRATAASGTQQRLLTFTGSGTAQVEPDSASISAGVTATGSSADEAQDAASRKMRELVAHMKRLELASSDLQTTEASVHEDWEHEGRFLASQSLAIRVGDPSRTGQLLGEATQAGADTVSGPSFGLEDQRAGYDEALRTAIADARAKADAAAAHLGAEVRAVYSIGETAAAGGGPMLARESMAVTADAATKVPTEQGTQTVSMTVEVSFTYEH